MTKLKGILIMARPYYTGFVILIAITGMFFTNRKLSTSFILPAIAIGLHYMAICVKDDIEDLEVDLIINESRPLVTKSVTIKEAYALWILLHAIALPLSLLVSLEFFLIMLLFIPIGILYTQRPFRFSDRSILGNVFFVWFSVPLPFIAGSFAVQSLNFEVVIAALSLWVWILIIDLLKDFVLLERNRLETRTSFVMNLGIEKASKIYSLTTLLFILVFPIIFFLLQMNLVFLIIMSIVGAWIIFITVQLFKDMKAAKKLMRHTYFIIPPILACSFIIGVISL